MSTFRYVPVALGIVFGFTLACFDGGANFNEQNPGTQEGGTVLGAGDIAVSETGDYIAFSYNQHLAIGWTDSARLDLLDVQYPSKLAFQHGGPRVFVASSETNKLTSLDVRTGNPGWEVEVPNADPDVFHIDVSLDDQWITTHDDQTVQIFDAASGALEWTWHADRPIIDVDILPDSERVVVVEQEEWVETDTVESRITVLDLDMGVRRSFTIPNCASKIEVLPHADLGFVAPTQCQNDPVTVIDLVPEHERYMQNLPGFGPVSVSPDGWTVVAFLAKSQADPSLFDDPSDMPGPTASEYHLMVIDGTDLSWTLVDYGDRLPRYTITPNGQVILVDSTYGDSVSLYDLETRTYRSVEGPKVWLDHFAMSSNGQSVYVLHKDGGFSNPGLFTIDLERADSWLMDLEFVPTNINITPNDRVLLLREDPTRICIYEIDDARCRDWFDMKEMLALGI